jgi:hypothetical protein
MDSTLVDRCSRSDSADPLPPSRLHLTRPARSPSSAMSWRGRALGAFHRVGTRQAAGSIKRSSPETGPGNLASWPQLRNGLGLEPTKRPSPPARLISAEI